MTGGYITYDGGELWRMFNLWNLRVEALGSHLADPDVIYASNPRSGAARIAAARGDTGSPIRVWNTGR